MPFTVHCFKSLVFEGHVPYLEVDIVSSEIQRFAQKHKERLHHHENVEAHTAPRHGHSAQTPEEKTF
jgi:hypothetical protein